MSQFCSFVYPCDVCDISGTLTKMGNDYALTLQGGTKPHIGTTVMAIPRPSLTGSGMSATVSCLNRLGHLDDIIAQDIAKRLASATQSVVVCTCGIHIDNATPKEITSLQHIGESLTAVILENIHHISRDPKETIGGSHE